MATVLSAGVGGLVIERVALEKLAGDQGVGWLGLDVLHVQKSPFPQTPSPSVVAVSL